MTPRAYFEGRKARESGQLNDAPGYLSPVLRSWWLAGWNDRDIELK